MYFCKINFCLQYYKFFFEFLKKSYKCFTERYSYQLFEILLTVVRKGGLSSFSKRNTEEPANELVKH